MGYSFSRFVLANGYSERDRDARPVDTNLRVIAPQVLLGAVVILIQSVFAVLYLVGRASWVTAALASGVWLAWIVVVIAAQFVRSRSIMTEAADPVLLVAGVVGTIAGSLVWAGLALSYFHASVFEERKE